MFTNPKPLTLTMLALALVAALPIQALQADPSVIEFQTMTEAKTVQLTNNGKPVPASAMGNIKLYAGGHDYHYMITVKKSDGAITVRPAEDMEIGSYDLVVETTEGNATLTMLAPLDNLSTSLESRSKRLGITVDELKVRLGLTQKIGNENVDLGIPSVYYIGQTLTIPMEKVDGRFYNWSVNGTTVQLGRGDAPMSYTFTEPGVYDFVYVEKEGDRIVTTGFAATTVVPEPSVYMQIDVEKKQKFVAPEGYAHYVWLVDGVKASQQKDFIHDFKGKGSHVVTLRAHTPLPGTLESLRQVTYVVTAT